MQHDDSILENAEAEEMNEKEQQANDDETNEEIHVEWAGFI